MCICACVYRCVHVMHMPGFVHEYVHVYTCVCRHDVCVFVCIACVCLPGWEGHSLEGGRDFPPGLVSVILCSSLTPAFNTYQLVVLQPTSVSNSRAALDIDSHERTVFSRSGLWHYVSQQERPI